MLDPDDVERLRVTATEWGLRVGYCSDRMVRGMKLSAIVRYPDTSPDRWSWSWSSLFASCWQKLRLRRLFAHMPPHDRIVPTPGVCTWSSRILFCGPKIIMAAVQQGGDFLLAVGSSISYSHFCNPCHCCRHHSRRYCIESYCGWAHIPKPNRCFHTRFYFWFVNTCGLFSFFVV